MMKHNLLYILIFCSVSLAAKAQTDFGLKGGASLTFFNQSNGIFGENPDIELGYFTGVFLDIYIDKGFHIQPELLYKGIGDFEFLNLPMYQKIRCRL